jgi:hypothetical protein
LSANHSILVERVKATAEACPPMPLDLTACTAKRIPSSPFNHAKQFRGEPLDLHPKTMN